MIVPFLDLKTQYESIKNEVDKTIKNVLESSNFAGGPFVEQFETAFAQYCNVNYAVGVSSGTDALKFALQALEIGSGDEVITVPNTFIATAEAITATGATPVFIDIDEKTYTMNPKLLESAITSKTKAVIPVHIFGQMADMDPIMSIAKKNKLYVVEDACQAHGSEYKGTKAGSIGHAGCFSFYPGKNLGAYGEAGSVVTNDQALADSIKMIRDHGQSRKYYHDIIGSNGRMDGIQGAILNLKLKHLDDWNNMRILKADEYHRSLRLLEEVTLPFRAGENKHVYHLYVIRVKKRDYVLTTLKEKQIYCGIHYPLSLHLQKAYHSLGYKKGDFPVAEKCADEFLSLPMFPEIQSEQINYASEELSSIVVRE